MSEAAKYVYVDDKEKVERVKAGIERREKNMGRVIVLV
jgi:hypothetical protein